jgi:excisionase family DNA binding protein
MIQVDYGAIMLGDWLSTKEAARHLGVSIPTLNRWVRRGRVRFYVLEANGRRRFKREDLDALLRPPEPRDDSGRLP